MKPTKARAVKRSWTYVKAFAMILDAPHPFPQCFIIAGDHATFAAGGHDFVLAEGPGGHITKSANRTALVERSMRLCAIFDSADILLFAGSPDCVNVAWPAGEMNIDDGTRLSGDGCGNGRCLDILAIITNINKNRDSASIYDDRCRCDKASRA